MKRLFKNVLQLTENEFIGRCAKNINDENKMFIVTANPEIFIKAKYDNAILRILTSPETSVVADGIGIVKGAQILGHDIPERITGVDLTTHLLEHLHQFGLKLYLYGAQPEVLEKLVEVIHEKYKKIQVVGYVDGFIKDQNLIAEEILMKKTKI